MNNNIYFSIPGYLHHYRLNMKLLELKNTDSEKFYDNVIIDSVYDCVPNCIWNGGRVLFESMIPIQDLKEIIFNYNEFGLSVKHTFTNEILTKNHLYDTLGNAVLELSKDSFIQTGITINSELLYEYINKNFKNKFYFTWSATKCLSDIFEINLLSKNDLVVPSYQYINNNWEKIRQLENRHNIEFIVDECCIENCPNYRKHYIEFNKEQLYQSNFNINACNCAQKLNYYERRYNRFHNIHIEDIKEKYLPLGFNKFKISGREEIPFNLIESYVNYFVKPEFKDYIRSSLLYEIYR